MSLLLEVKNLRIFTNPTVTVVLFYILLSQCIALNSWGQYRLGPSAQSLGGAGIAAVDPSESPSMNPASLGHIQYNYLSFGFQSERFVNGENSEKSSVLVIDASNDIVVTGSLLFVKNRQRRNDSSIIDEKFYSLSLGKLLLGSLSFGFSFNRLEQHYLAEEKSIHTSDFGVMYSPISDLGLAFVAHNFIGSGEQLLPKTYTVGTHYMYQKLLRFRLDYKHWQGLENVEDKGQTKLGMEIPLGKWASLRAGYTWDGINDRHLPSLGLAWLGPRLQILYAYHNNADAPKQRLHSIDMLLFF